VPHSADDPLQRQFPPIHADFQGEQPEQTITWITHGVDHAEEAGVERPTIA